MIEPEPGPLSPGDQHHAHLAGPQKIIPEKSPNKVAKAKGFKQARAAGDEVSGLNDWNVRWVGPDGYQGIVARQLQEFKRRQRERADKEGELAGAESVDEAS